MTVRCKPVRARQRLRQRGVRHPAANAKPVYAFHSGAELAFATVNDDELGQRFFFAQQAAVLGWGQMAKPTFRKEDDYGFIAGVGTEMAYGVSKMFKKHAMYVSGSTLNSSASGNTSGGGLSSLVQWGTVTGFMNAAVDA